MSLVRGVAGGDIGNLGKVRWQYKEAALKSPLWTLDELPDDKQCLDMLT